MGIETIQIEWQEKSETILKPQWLMDNVDVSIICIIAATENEIHWKFFKK